MWPGVCLKSKITQDVCFFESFFMLMYAMTIMTFLDRASLLLIYESN